MKHMIATKPTSFACERVHIIVSVLHPILLYHDTLITTMKTRHPQLSLYYLSYLLLFKCNQG